MRISTAIGPLTAQYLCAVLLLLNSCHARVLCGVACKDGVVLLMDNSLSDSSYFGSRGASPEYDAPIKRISPYLRASIAYGGSRRGLHLLWQHVGKEVARSLARANVQWQGQTGELSLSDTVSARAIATVTQRVIREHPQILDQARKQNSEDDDAEHNGRRPEFVYNTLVVGVDDNQQPAVYEISPGGYLVLHSYAMATKERPPIALGSSSPACVAIAQALEQRDASALELCDDAERCLEDICRYSNIAGRVSRRLMSLAVMDEAGMFKHRIIEPKS